MSAFKGPDFEELKIELKKEFPLDKKNPENSKPLHIQLHKALDGGNLNCQHIISAVLRPHNAKTMSPEKIKLYDSLYMDFMKIVSAAMSGTIAA